MLLRPNFLRQPSKVDARGNIRDFAQGIISLELVKDQRVYMAEVKIEFEREGRHFE